MYLPGTQSVSYKHPQKIWLKRKIDHVWSIAALDRRQDSQLRGYTLLNIDIAEAKFAKPTMSMQNWTKPYYFWLVTFKSYLLKMQYNSGVYKETILRGILNGSWELLEWLSAKNILHVFWKHNLQHSSQSSLIMKCATFGCHGMMFRGCRQQEKVL